MALKQRCNDFFEHAGDAHEHLRHLGSCRRWCGGRGLFRDLARLLMFSVRGKLSSLKIFLTCV